MNILISRKRLLLIRLICIDSLSEMLCFYSDAASRFQAVRYIAIHVSPRIPWAHDHSRHSLAVLPSPRFSDGSEWMKHGTIPAIYAHICSFPLCDYPPNEKTLCSMPTPSKTHGAYSNVPSSQHMVSGLMNVMAETVSHNQRQSSVRAVLNQPSG